MFGPHAQCTKHWSKYEYLTILIELPFYRSFLSFWNVSGGLCTEVFYSQVRGELKSSVT